MTGKITPTRLTQTRARSQTHRSFYIARNAGRVIHIQLMRGKYSSIKEHLSMQPRSHGAAGAGAAKTSGRGENAARSGGRGGLRAFAACILMPRNCRAQKRRMIIEEMPCLLPAIRRSLSSLTSRVSDVGADRDAYITQPITHSVQLSFEAIVE